jgi:hypothetical protein
MSMRILKYLLIKQEMISMIKQIAWNTFKNTGNIDTFMELMEVENVEKTMKGMYDYGNNKNEGNNNSRKQYERL